jgi:hypothetical protein
LNIQQILALDNGIKGVVVSGKVTKAFPAEHKTGTSASTGKPYDFWSQNIIVIDATGSITCGLGLNDSIEAVVGGQSITVSGTVGDYKGAKQLQRCKIVMAAPQPSGTDAPKTLQNAPQQANRGGTDVGIQIIRQNALSHATALVVAGKIGLGDLFQWASDFAAYSEGGRKPSDVDTRSIDDLLNDAIDPEADKY